MISELTYKVVAFPEIQQVYTNECIDWAIEMIALGYQSPTLYMLASFTKPTNYFEVINYVKSSVRELGLEMKSGVKATSSFASYYVQQIDRGERVKENLIELYRFCQMRDYEELAYDFYLHFWSWDYLDYEDNEHNPYWHGARRNNIKLIVMEEARKWINKNEKHYAQQFLAH